MALLRNILMAFLAAAIFSGAAAASDETFKSEVRRQLIESSPWDKGDIEIDEIQFTNFDPGIRYDGIRVNVPAGMKNIGKIGISVTVSKDGRDKTFWGTARVRVFRDTVVALNTLKMNQRIAKEDLKLVRMEVRDIPDAAESMEEVAGMLVKRPITAGSVIKRDYLKPEIVIRRGERVTLNLENGKFRIRTTGIATEDGHRGGVISARTASGKEVSGKVTGPGEMSIEF